MACKNVCIRNERHEKKEYHHKKEAVAAGLYPKTVINLNTIVRKQKGNNFELARSERATQAPKWHNMNEKERLARLYAWRWANVNIDFQSTNHFVCATKQA